MKPLKVGISGVRGVAGEALTPALAMDFASAFGTHLDRGRVLVGRDPRLLGFGLCGSRRRVLRLDGWRLRSPAGRATASLVPGRHRRPGSRERDHTQKRDDAGCMHVVSCQYTPTLRGRPSAARQR